MAKLYQCFFQHCYFKVSVNSNRWVSKQNFTVQLWKYQCLNDVKIVKDFKKIHCINNFCRFIHFLTHVCVRFQVFLTLISTITIRLHFQLSSQTQSKLSFCSAEKTHLPENCTQKLLQKYPTQIQQKWFHQKIGITLGITLFLEYMTSFWCLDDQASYGSGHLPCCYF